MVTPAAAEQQVVGDDVAGPVEDRLPADVHELCARQGERHRGFHGLTDRPALRRHEVSVRTNMRARPGADRTAGTRGM